MEEIRSCSVNSSYIEKAEALQERPEFKTIEIKATNLKDCYVLSPKKFGDNRGSLGQIDIEPLELLGFKGLKKIIKSDNPLRGVIRGMHLQKGFSSQTKVVRCISGKVMDVVIDLREDSETFGQWTGVELTPENDKSLYVPRGFAHGYLAAEDNTSFLYFVDNVYDKSSEAGLLYNDHDVNIDWETILDSYEITKEELNFSDKDKKHPGLYRLKEIEREEAINLRHDIIMGINPNYLNEDSQNKLYELEKRISNIDSLLNSKLNKKLVLNSNILGEC